MERSGTSMGYEETELIARRTRKQRDGTPSGSSRSLASSLDLTQRRRRTLTTTPARLGPPHTGLAAVMSLLRSRMLTTPRTHLQIIPNLAARAHTRPLSSTAVRSAGDHAHEDHYDPPGGWLFGVKPGEKYENEGWENVWFYGFFGTMAFGVIGYCYKPDTR